MSDLEFFNPTDDSSVCQFQFGKHRNFIYLVLDRNTREAALIDTQKGMSPLFELLKKHDLVLTRIFLTHTHFDHTEGLSEIHARYPGIPVTVHRAGSRNLSSDQIDTVSNGQKVTLGPTSPLTLEILHTPGHTADSCCYRLNTTKHAYLFTGDTLFIRDCGRTDLEGGNTALMFESLQRIKSLTPATVILPGHQYTPENSSTLQKELTDNPALRCTTLEEFAALP